MAKTVEFHDAQIVVRLRVMNEDGSTDQVISLQPSIACVNSAAEWASVGTRIDEAINGLEEQVNGNGDPGS